MSYNMNIPFIWFHLYWRVVQCPESDTKVLWRLTNNTWQIGTQNEIGNTTSFHWATNYSLEFESEPLVGIKSGLEIDHNNSQPYYYLSPSGNECHGTCPCPLKTNLRNDSDYVLYFLTMAQGLFMGVLPMTLMIIFNVLVSIMEKIDRLIQYCLNNKLLCDFMFNKCLTLDFF